LPERLLILIATNRFDPTADHVLLELRGRGADVVRFNTEDVPVRARLTLRLSSAGPAGSLEVGGRCFDIEEIESVWYRRPGLPEPSEEIADSLEREFAVDESDETLLGLWRVLGCLWVSRPDALNAASYKPAQLKAAAEVGLEVPRSIITNDPEEACAFVEGLDVGTVVKPLRFGLVRETDEHQDVVFTQPVRPEDLEGGMGAVAWCPTYLQEYVPKDVEIRATVVGDEVLAAEIRSQETAESRHDWRRADVKDVPHLPHELPVSVAERCVSVVKHFGLAFGAMDLIRTPDGRYVFLEVNPNGQWLWVEILTGLPITDALCRLLMGSPTKA